MGKSSIARRPEEKASCSLDDALEQVILALEGHEPLDKESLIAAYPQWSKELSEFIDNWLAMEKRTAPMSELLAADFDESMENLNGKIVGDYELMQLISSGGMGVVYRARQISLVAWSRSKWS